MQTIQLYDYYHTKEYAHKMLPKKKKTSAAAYALAYIYFQNYQPFHHLDSADKYIHLAILNYSHKPYITKYGTIDSNAIYTLYDSITIHQFQKITHHLNPRSYDIFLSHHPFVSSDVKKHIKTHQYNKILEYAHKINKSDTTFYLITTYSENPNNPQLFQLLDKQIFNEFTAHHTAAEYLNFLRNYPKNSYREIALQNLLDIYIKEKNTAGLREYAKEFSKDKHYSEQAWKWLFTYSVKRVNNEELEKFIEEYPDFPFKKEILAEMEMNNKILIPLADTTELIGFIDTTGHFVIPPIYDAVTPFKENLSVVIKDDSAFFINKLHQAIIPQKFVEAYPFHNGYAPVFDGKNWYFINRLGAQQSDNFDWISELSSDFNYVFKKNGYYGLCDYKGQVILPATFEKLGDFENQKSYYLENNLYGIVYDDGTKFPAQYQWLSSFYDSVAIVKQNNFYGLINLKNKIILNPQYDFIYHCTDDIFLIVKNKKYGYYSVSEKCFIYFPNYDFVKEFEFKHLTNKNLFKLNNQNKIFIGNKNGSILQKKFYQDAIIHSNFLLVKEKNKWSLLDPVKFSPLNNLKYSEITICNEKMLIGKLPDKNVIIDINGKIIYETPNELKYIKDNYFYEENDKTGKIINVFNHKVLTNILDYQIQDQYLIIRTSDNGITVMK
ncbi:MAG: hypothetical protein KatS3mg027_2043 [Bacteroidia bacterium]|nr:MAG: hypothetical protein KatS3mg027_2043 [Bacteroidia bacterium]